MGSISFILAVLAISALFAWLCAVIAKKLGARPIFWGVMGFMFGPFAIPFIYLARKQRP